MMDHSYFDRRSITKSKAPAVRWFKEWVPQDVVATGGKCFVMKWVTEATMRTLKDRKHGTADMAEPEPEPTTEVLFLCSADSCGKTFVDAGALRKHSHVHGEKQYICHYQNCAKKFLDSSKLKRHFLTHTGEKKYVCPHQGCGRAFSLDFNLRSHMKTHSQENYHICPYPECGKRYAHEYKLKNHISAHHEKQTMVEVVPKYVPPPEKPVKTSKSTAASHNTVSLERPYACPYQGCEKAYIHEYKLNLHLRREHPGHFPDENTKNTPNNADNDVDENSDHEGTTHGGKRGSGKVQKQSRQKPSIKLPPAKVQRKATAAPAAVVKKPWPVKEEVYDEEDSEETEEDCDNVEDGWRYGDSNNNNNNNNHEDDDDEDDEETEDEE